MKRKIAFELTLPFLMIMIVASSFPVAHGESLESWSTGEGGQVSESSGVMEFSGDEHSPGALIYKAFAPINDFEISFQLKAETLGEIDRDPNGAGEGFMLFLWADTNFGIPNGVAFEMRARGGGQFLLDRHDNAWGWDWTPFIYNTLEYNDGYSFWHNSPESVTKNALVKPNVWYTIKIAVQKSPFVVTATVINEMGNEIGSLSISDMIDFSFNNIKFLGLSSGFGGTFYVRDFTVCGVENVSEPFLTIAANPSVVVGSPVRISGTLMSNGVALANELIVLKYTFPGGDEWYPISSAQTDSNGDYFVEWLTTATGTFTLRAEWKGDGTIPGVQADVTLNSLPIQNAVFFVESNSTVESLAFNSAISEFSFTVTGPSNTSGYVKATVAKSLLPDGANARIFLDGNQLTYELQETSDSWTYIFNYQHSTHIVTLDLSSSSVSPVFPEADYSILILTAVAASAFVLVFGIFRQKRKTAQTPETHLNPPDKS